MTFQGRRSKLVPFVREAAVKSGIEFSLLDGIIVTESAYDQWAVRYEKHVKVCDDVALFARRNGISRSSEMQLERFSWGLAQIMGTTARWLGYHGPLTALCLPENNLPLMIKYIEKLQRRYRKREEIISAYNAGSVRREANGEFRNQMYVDKVLRNIGLHDGN